jgi:hypothetical protein
VLNDRASFPRAVREAVAALYPPFEKMDPVLDEDGRRFRTSMERAGLDPGLKVNGVEPINALAAKYEANIDLRQAAAEFGLTTDEFTERQSGDPRANALARRLKQGLAPRDQFEKDFAALVPKFTDDDVLDIGALTPPQVAATPGAPAAPVALAKVTEPGGFDLALVSEKPEYRQNDLLVLSVVAKQDCALTLVNVDHKGTGTLIFPNKFQADNYVSAGKEVKIPPNTDYRLRLADRGTESVVAECTATKPGSTASTRGFKPDYKGGVFTDLGNYSRALTRQIVVEADNAKKTTQQTGGPAKTAGTAPVTARTAIKIEVK